MELFEAVEPASLLAGRGDWIDADQLKQLSEHPLECIETEFPHYVHSVDSADDFEQPAEQHPVFHGCFDWHSAVHSHWSLVRQLRLFDHHPAEERVEGSLDARFTAENVRSEVEHFEENPTFEEPYGWAWFLRLASELHLWDDHRAEDWRAVLRPLEEQIVELVDAELFARDRPIRVGTHGNTAFALQGILDYARVTGNADLESGAVAVALEHFGDDEGYPIDYEPLGWDFLSPALVEADLLARVLDGDAFARWLEGFLPHLAESPPATVLDPIDVESDSESGLQLHLVGLNLSRAWSLAEIADALGDHHYVPVLEEGAKRHAKAGIDRAFTDAYPGAHWLSSFVVYLLTRTDGAINPE